MDHCVAAAEKRRYVNERDREHSGECASPQSKETLHKKTEEKGTTEEPRPRPRPRPLYPNRPAQCKMIEKQKKKKRIERREKPVQNSSPEPARSSQPFCSSGREPDPMPIRSPHQPRTEGKGRIRNKRSVRRGKGKVRITSGRDAMNSFLFFPSTSCSSASQRP